MATIGRSTVLTARAQRPSAAFQTRRNARVIVQNLSDELERPLHTAEIGGGNGKRVLVFWNVEAGKGALFIIATGIVNVLLTQLRYGFANRAALHVGMGICKIDGREALAPEDVPRFLRGNLGD